MTTVHAATKPASKMADTTTLLSNWPYAWAIFYPVTLLLIAIGTFTPAAHALCEQAGFPQPRDQPLNTYVYLLAGTQFMIGSALAMLEYAGEWRAVSVIICCATPMGLLGTSLSAMRSGEGFGGAFWTHALLTTVGTSAGWRLLQNHW
jgi:hypothetical protein